MDSTVREHITRFKSRIDLLTSEMTDGRRTQNDRSKLKAEIETAYLALAHYEAALKQERKLSPLQDESAA